MRYFLKNTLNILIVFISLNACSQNNAQVEQFEKKLNEFKYSLYPMLDTIDDINNFMFAIDSTHPILKKIESFIQENKGEISDYKINKLKTFTSVDIELKQFEKDKLFSEKDFDIKQMAVGSIGAWLNYFNIDPLSYAFMLESIYNARIFSPKEMGEAALTDRFASPRIKTKELQGGQWKIWIDHYSRLYEFDYLPNKNDIKLVGFYRRKK